MLNERKIIIKDLSFVLLTLRSVMSVSSVKGTEQLAHSAQGLLYGLTAETQASIMPDALM